MIREKCLYPKRVTVWCILWAGGLIGRYFFEDETRKAVTVNGDRYRHMITQFLWPQLQDLNVEDLWFQQDGATNHTAVETTLLRERFPTRLISRNGDQN